MHMNSRKFRQARLSFLTETKVLSKKYVYEAFAIPPQGLGTGCVTQFQGSEIQLGIPSTPSLSSSPPPPPSWCTVLPLPTYSLKTFRGGPSKAPRIINLVTRWSSVVSLTLRLLYFRTLQLRRPLNRELGWRQSGLDLMERSKHLPVPGIKPQSYSLQPVTLLSSSSSSSLFIIHGVHCAGLPNFSVCGAARRHFSRQVAQLFRRKFRR
jgi:hypothetical protein